jgi:hypothetical protein
MIIISAGEALRAQIFVIGRGGRLIAAGYVRL